jgi:hypothetical protein
MRKILIGVAVLLMAGTAWGQNVSMSLSSNKTDVIPGETFTVILEITTDVGLAGWNAKFLEPAGFGVQPSYSAGGGWDTNTAATAIAWAGDTLPLGSANGTGLLGSSPLDVILGASSGPVWQMLLTVPAAQPLGTVFVTATEASVGDVDFNDYFLQVEPLAINVVPEPVSALLLLAGLPMLRRRR